MHSRNIQKSDPSSQHGEMSFCRLLESDIMFEVEIYTCDVHLCTSARLQIYENVTVIMYMYTKCVQSVYGMSLYCVLGII